MNIIIEYVWILLLSNWILSWFNLRVLLQALLYFSNPESDVTVCHVTLKASMSRQQTSALHTRSHMGTFCRCTKSEENDKSDEDTVKIMKKIM